MVESAGIILYRHREETEIFLVHMGGPLWAGRDAGAWSIPKGVIGNREDPFEAAKREFREETGFTPTGAFRALGRFKQNSGKHISVWMVEGDCDPSQLVSQNFSMIWPPKSGKQRRFPEADRGGWFGCDAALAKIVKGQRVVIERFFETERSRADPNA